MEEVEDERAPVDEQVVYRRAGKRGASRGCKAVSEDSLGFGMLSLFGRAVPGGRRLVGDGETDYASDREGRNPLRGRAQCRGLTKGLA